MDGKIPELSEFQICIKRIPLLCIIVNLLQHLKVTVTNLVTVLSLYICATNFFIFTSILKCHAQKLQSQLNDCSNKLFEVLQSFMILISVNKIRQGLPKNGQERLSAIKVGGKLFLSPITSVINTSTAI